MNFFEQQKKTEKKTVFFIILFVLCTLCIAFVVSYPICLLVLPPVDQEYHYSPIYVFSNSSPKLILTIFLITVVFVASNSTYKMIKLAKDSPGYVIGSLNGRLCARYRANARETVLLNVVEEIAIASGIPPPPVYILSGESTINAFAAGNSHDDAVIGITAGAVKYLTREELQGVIAHEFSHIFNRDIKLNIFTIAVLNGILAISLAGEFLVRASTSGSSRKGKGRAQLFLLGACLYIIGYIGIFFGNIIKAAINREREYLADATAAQFTRYPKGLADALKKIGGFGSFMSSERSSEFSHLYFAKGIKYSLFNSHPNINKRIYALDPAWDGKYLAAEPTEEPVISKEDRERAIREEKNRKFGEYWASLPLMATGPIPTLDKAVKLDKAAQTIKEIPPILYGSSADAQGAQYIIFSIIFAINSNSNVEQIASDSQKETTGGTSDGTVKFETIQKEVKRCHSDLYLDIVNLCIPTLKTLTLERYLKFKELLIKLMMADRKVTWRELNLKYLVLYPLDITFGIRKPAKEIYDNIASIRADVETLLSKFTYHQFYDDAAAFAAFRKTIAAFNINAAYLDSNKITIADVEKAFDTVQKATLIIRKKIFDMSAACLKTDGSLSSLDNETIHALSALLHLPPEIG
jgi:Zn-dependent protease with chaperone function